VCFVGEHDVPEEVIRIVNVGHQFSSGAVFQCIAMEELMLWGVFFSLTINTY
jgi:hypothetical protein